MDQLAFISALILALMIVTAKTKQSPFKKKDYQSPIRPLSRKSKFPN